MNFDDAKPAVRYNRAFCGVLKPRLDKGFEEGEKTFPQKKGKRKIVAKELNITKAAQRLFISQQALSNHIRHLEKYYETRLFNRTPALELTYAGARLVKAATKILDLYRQIRNEIDDINHHRRGKLQLGISHTRGRAFLPDILPQFKMDHPLVEITLEEGNSAVLEEMLFHGRIDLLIGFAPILLDTVETVEILRERLFLVVPKMIMQALFEDKTEFMRGKFTESADITVFQHSPFLLMSTGNRTRTIFDHYLKQCNITPNIILETENIETLLALSLKGMGITVYPEMFIKNLSLHLTRGADSPVDFSPLNDPETVGTLVIGYMRDKYLSNAVRDFIALTRHPAGF
ncbi:MAG: LysR family transcriptional regulator [Bacillota bacterium]